MPRPAGCNDLTLQRFNRLSIVKERPWTLTLDSVSVLPCHSALRAPNSAFQLLHLRSNVNHKTHFLSAPLQPPNQPHPGLEPEDSGPGQSERWPWAGTEHRRLLVLGDVRHPMRRLSRDVLDFQRAGHRQHGVSNPAVFHQPVVRECRRASRHEFALSSIPSMHCRHGGVQLLCPSYAVTQSVVAADSIPYGDSNPSTTRHPVQTLQAWHARIRFALETIPLPRPHQAEAKSLCPALFCRWRSQG